MDESSKASDSEKILNERKEKLNKFLKNKGSWIYYVILGFIVWLGVYIRTLNLSKLKDVTTGTWTLGPDLDPFLFLRWAKYIVQNGSLMVLDSMRYVPLSYDTSAEKKLLSYLIAEFHNILSFFSLTDSVTYSAIIFPVFMFALTTIVFFLFARKIFYKEDLKIRNIIALIATLFFVLIPSLLPRTIAGIPEKESVAIGLIFLSFYLFLEAFTSEKTRNSLIFGALAGISTATTGLIWGGVSFIFIAINGATGLAFILGKVDKKRLYSFGLWITLSIILTIPFSIFDIAGTFKSITTSGGAIALFLIMFIDIYIVKKNLFKLKDKSEKMRIPSQILSLILIALILIILIVIILGPNFIVEVIQNIIDATVRPLGGSRLLVTVAENRQPYFIGEWRQDFGPIMFNIPIFFWFFFIGSVLIFNHMLKDLKKRERWILTLSYLLFLFCLVFSRYAPHPNLLDGEGNLSLLMYFGGVLIFMCSFGYIYLKKYRDGTFEEIEKFNFAYMFYLIILSLAIVGARGGVRLIMILAAVSPVAASFFSVKTISKAFKEKEETLKFFMVVLAIIVVFLTLFTIWNYYQVEKSTAANFAPGIYQVQWQKAMEWVRNDTPTNAVFAHWWDYGYWVQTIGERATVLDGGNAIAYWNYLMGRNVLTGIDEKETLEFLYAHNTTHLLIDSTDIGKYTAFSSIGSDKNYDRFSWISTFIVDEKQTQETNNETIHVYIGGSSTDEDIIWNDGGKEIFLPARKTGIGAIILKKDIQGNLLQPQAIFIYNSQQHSIPLKYAYYNNTQYNFDSGLDAGIFIYPSVTQNNNQLAINNMGAILYLSKRTIHSNLAKLYLFDQKTDYFKLAYTESHPIIENLRQQGVQIGEFIQYQEFIGPIKIWEIKYPSYVEFKKEYVQKEYIDPELSVAKSGVYN